MDWQKKHTENSYFIKLYLDYMQNTSLPYYQAIALMTEVGRLNTYNSYIENMYIEDYMQPVEEITIKQESIL